MRRATTVIDAHGGTVTAGFRDGNVDLKAGGLALLPQPIAPTPQASTTTPQTGTSTPEANASGWSAGRRNGWHGGSDDRRRRNGDTLDAIQQAIGYANSVGVTSVGVTARTPDDLLPYDTLLRTRELTARVNAALTAEWPLDEAAVARLDALRKRYEGVPLFKLKAVRLTVTHKAPKDQAKPAKKLTNERSANRRGNRRESRSRTSSARPRKPPGRRP